MKTKKTWIKLGLYLVLFAMLLPLLSLIIGKQEAPVEVIILAILCPCVAYTTGNFTTKEGGRFGRNTKTRY